MKEIMEKILNNPELSARYKALNEDYAAGLAKLARDAGFNVTEQEIASELASASGELSEDSLNQVSAGHSVATSCMKNLSYFHKINVE